MRAFFNLHMSCKSSVRVSQACSWKHRPFSNSVFCLPFLTDKLLFSPPEQTSDRDPRSINPGVMRCLKNTSAHTRCLSYFYSPSLMLHKCAGSDRAVDRLLHTISGRSSVWMAVPIYHATEISIRQEGKPLAYHRLANFVEVQWPRGASGSAQQCIIPSRRGPASVNDATLLLEHTWT